MIKSTGRRLLVSRNSRCPVRNRTIRQKSDGRSTKNYAPGLRFRKQREQLVVNHLPLIRLIVHRLASRLPKWIDSADLINTGVIGLMDAVTKFDVSHNVQFKTYAELRIRGAILDSLRNMDWAPRSWRQKERMIQQTTDELTQKLGRGAEDKEIAQAMGMGLRDYQKMLDEVKGVTFGNFQRPSRQEGSEDSMMDPIEFVPADEETSPHRICERSEMRGILGRFIDDLPEKERLVVSLYYYEELSMSEIGRILRVNESRVSQIHHKAMFSLRRRLKNVLLDGSGS